MVPYDNRSKGAKEGSSSLAIRDISSWPFEAVSIKTQCDVNQGRNCFGLTLNEEIEVKLIEDEEARNSPLPLDITLCLSI